MTLTTVLLSPSPYANASDAANQHALYSLPPAGFRISRACDLRCAIGMFTTHRADSSWT